MSSKAESMGIKSYGVSMTTLEEVFMKLGKFNFSCIPHYGNCFWFDFVLYKYAMIHVSTCMYRCWDIDFLDHIKTL